MKRKFLSVCALGMAVCILATGCKSNPEDGNKENKYISYIQVSNIESGISWPEGQILPTFATPAETVDMISITAFTSEEQITATALQGLVNKTKPRILFLDNNPDEGSTTWPRTEIMNLNTESHKKAGRYDLVKKYIGEVSGAVLYDSSETIHYRNLASSVAAAEGLLPIEKDVYEDWKNEGIELEVKIDLTNLTYKSEVDIYNYLYDNYWKDMQHRILISADPGDCQHIRDMAAATGAAVVWLDCTNDDQKAVFEKFLGDMEAGNGIVLGWYTTERSGITTVTKYGLSTVPANLYINSTIYSGTDHKILIPDVPDKPELENKVYIALYISDGDNIQYNQRYMRKLWDQSEKDRGKVAINWTISPSLVDIGAGLMNYYYTTATDKDCFVAGPSGLGYSMPVNTLEEPGAPAINYLEDDKLMESFVKLTNTYLQRSGLRVVTVWDNLSVSQRSIYSSNARYLYGLTVHDWHGRSNAASSVENGNMLVQQLIPCYGGNTDSLVGAWERPIARWDGESPLFLASQVSVWGEVKPADIVKLAEEMEEKYGGKVEFVRADHYYALYSEANGLPFDLSMSSKVKVSATSGETSAANTLDGTPVSIWEGTGQGEQTITYDFGGQYSISRYVIRHAGENGMDASLNTKNYVVEVSADGNQWTVVDEYKNNAENVTDIDIEAVDANYLRIRITDAGADGIARIADVEIYGTKK